MPVGTTGAAPGALVRPSESSERSFGSTVTLALLLTTGLAYSFNAMDRQVLPALLGPINREYGLTLAQAGFLSTCFAAVMAVFGAFSGWCMARIGRKWTLVGGLIFYSIFTFLMPFATSFAGLTMYRSLTGVGLALHIGANWAILGAYFGSKRGTAGGIVNSIYGLGAFVGPMLGAYIYAATGSWRVPFYIYGVAGIVMALSFAIFVPNSFTSAMDVEKLAADAPNQRSTTRLFNRNSVLFGIAWFLVGYCYFAFSGLYTIYLRNQHGFSVVSAGAVFGMYGIGAMTAMFCGWLGDKWKRGGQLWALALLPVVTYLQFHGAWPVWLHSIMCFGCGALISGYLYPRFTAVVQRSVAPDQIGHAMALMIPLFYLPGLVAGLLFGKLVGPLGWGHAATISVVLPAALGFIVTCFYDPRQVRGE